MPTGLVPAMQCVPLSTGYQVCLLSDLFLFCFEVLDPPDPPSLACSFSPDWNFLSVVIVAEVQILPITAVTSIHNTTVMTLQLT